MRTALNPTAILPTEFQNWMAARIETFIVSNRPEQLTGNVVGKLCSIGLKTWLIGISVPALTYCSMVLTIMVLLGLVIAMRQRNPVSDLERDAMLERPSMISTIGLRIPILPVHRWFATTMGRRFSRQLTRWLGQFVVVVAIILLNGTEFGIRHGVLLTLYPILAYISAKRSTNTCKSKMNDRR